MSLIPTNSPRAFIKSARFQTLGAMACPVFIGSALAMSHGYFSVIIFLVTLFCALLVQILANLVNDYGDFIRGSDNRDRLGPPRAMQMGWLTESAIKSAITVVLVTAVFLGIVLVLRGGFAILLLGLAAIACSIWYTAGPKPLAYLGFAEIAVALFFGPVPVMGTYYLQSLSMGPEVLVASIGPACLSTALIMTNNLRDINQDRHNHKKTVAVRCGERFSRNAIIALLIVSILAPCLLIIYFKFSWLNMCVCLTVVSLCGKINVLFEPISFRINFVLSAIGKMLYLYGIMLSIGIIFHV